jgi:hypothetical protein
VTLDSEETVSQFE